MKFMKLETATFLVKESLWRLPTFVVGMVTGIVLILAVGFWLERPYIMPANLQELNLSAEQIASDSATVKPVDTSVIYVVKKGDSTSKLAAAFYQNATKYPLIERANRLSHNQWLFEGQELVIPSTAATASTTPTTPTAPTAPTVTEVPRSKLSLSPAITSETYIVQPNDCLWFIAARYLGDGRRWVEIYRANLTVIGANPDHIEPGQQLTLPLQ